MQDALLAQSSIERMLAAMLEEAVESLIQQVPHLRASLQRIRELATHVESPIEGGWPLLYESTVAKEIASLGWEIDRWNEVADPEYLISSTGLDSGRWAEIFRVFELLNRVELGDGELIELWSTRQIRFTGHRLTSTLHYMKAKAETHAGVGWHIHLWDREGRLGYRFLFNEDRGREYLAWEAHGKGKLKYGDPAIDVIGRGRSLKIHSTALKAVGEKSLLAHVDFPEWAKLFVRPGAGTYVAHPPVKYPTRW